MPKSCAVIVKAANKRFRVRYYGKNGEILFVSEVLNTRNNANKNIKAGTLLFMKGDITVHDQTLIPKTWLE